MKRSMVISLIGRPNVGKSSLFNRLMKKQNKMITFDTPGVTRDRHYGLLKLADIQEDKDESAILVDTGGFYPQHLAEEGSDKLANRYFNIMAEQSQVAIQESDLVLFVVDAREGALPLDETIAQHLRKEKRPFWLIVNKFDTENQRGQEIEFYSLGLGPEEIFTTSAAHGLGFVELEEALLKKVKEFNNSISATLPGLQKGVTPREEVVAKIALIGAPNAGKSTLLNHLVGAPRALVSELAGTTIDPIEGFFDLYFGENLIDSVNDKDLLKNDGLLFEQYEEFRKNNWEFSQRMAEAYQREEEEEGENIEEFQFSDEVIAPQDSQEIEGSYWRSLHIVDTAGIRKKGQVSGFIESQSVYRSLRCITESDIVLHLVDAVKGVGHQDRRLIDIALEKGKSVIVVLNKMDLKREQFSNLKEQNEWIKDLRAEMPWLNFCDMIPLSALQGKGIGQLKKMIRKTVVVRRSVVPTGPLNREIFDLIENHPVILKGGRGKRFRVKYCSQVRSGPPTFLFFTNKSKGVPDNYRRYLKNGLRKAFQLDNTPIHLIFRTGTDLEQRMKKVKKKGEETSSSSV